MSNISGQNIDHLKLKSGLYIARKDEVSFETVTTFDLRLKTPYKEEVLDTGSMHALEHILYDYMVHDELWGDKIILLAPMGCRTGFYLVVNGNISIDEILPLIERAFDYAAEYEKEIPSALPADCGYCVDFDLEQAKIDAALYYNVLIEAKKTNFTYPLKKERKSKKA